MNTRIAQHSFASGEISPLLYGRDDFDRYYNSLSLCRNFIVMAQGGIFRRWGTRYVGGLDITPPVTLTLSSELVGSRTLTAGASYWIATDVGRVVASGAGRATITAYTNPTTVTATVTVAFASAGPIAAGNWTCSPARPARLMPFIFAADDAKVVCCNADFLTFYRYTSAGVPEEVASTAVTLTGITTAHLPAIQYTQTADVFSMAYPSWHPKDLIRLAADDTSWSLANAVLDIPATYEAGHTAAIVITLSDTTVGIGRTATAASPFWMQADIGRTVSYQTGRAVINGYASTTVVTVLILSAFSTVTLPASGWLLEGSPICNIYDISFQGYIIPAGRTVNLSSVDLANGLITAWRTSDAGKYLYIDGGIFYLSAYLSTTLMEATCMRTTDHKVGTYQKDDIGQYGFASLESVAWSATNGYPNACAIHQQRRTFGGTAEHPNTLWAGPTGDFFTISRGENDADGWTHAIGSGRVDAIKILSPGKVLGVGTVGEVHTMKGNSEETITPGSPGIKDSESGVGVAPISPVRMSGTLIFADRAQRSAYSMLYDFQRDGYIVSDLMEVANHRTASGQVAEFASGYLQGPLGKVPLVMARLNDTAGTVVALSFDLANKLIAWHVHNAADGGIIESVCCIPNRSSGYDEFWFVVNRTIGGVVTRTVEVLTAGRYLDCSITGTNGPASATITGLTHLEGESVLTRGKRASDSLWCVFPAETVTGGAITLDATVTDYEVGLAFIATATTMPLAIVGQRLQGVAKSYGPMTVLAYDTPCLQVNGVRYKTEAQEAGYAAATVYAIPTTDAIAPASTAKGTVFASGGVDLYGQVTLVQDLPIPTTILSLSAEVALGV